MDKNYHLKANTFCLLACLPTFGLILTLLEYDNGCFHLGKNHQGITSFAQHIYLKMGKTRKRVTKLKNFAENTCQSFVGFI